MSSVTGFVRSWPETAFALRVYGTLGCVHPAELTGILGWAERVMLALGEWGVGLLSMLETVFPPIPSEVVLPLAGFLSSQDQMSIPLVLLTSTVGAYLGAVFLYALAARFGQERSIRLLSRLPLVDREDFERADGWFSRHGRASIFFGRLIPGVRSLISLPAGAQRMNFAVFSLFTLAGTAVWNSVLIALGVALGTQYGLVQQYSRFLNYAVYVVLAGLLVWLIVRRVRRRRAGLRSA